MFTKKGDNEAKAVGVLILVIALMMTLYVIFIPPADREQLLNPHNSSSYSYSNSADQLELLSESPGLLSPEKKEKVDHNLVPINLFIKSEPKTFNIAQSLTVTQGLFSKSFPALSFNVDKKDLKKVTLFFSITNAKGELRISVNNNQFYSETAKEGVKVIEIPLSFLQEKNNDIKFSVSSPGLSFWSTNQFVLNEVGIKQEFELINSREDRTFSMPQVEKDSLQTAVLSFFQVCNMKLPKDTVPLKVYVNDGPIPTLSTRIRCTSNLQTVDINKEDLIAGQNKISFVLEEAGDFSFNEVKVTSEAKQTDYPQYSFAVSKDQFDSIKSGSKQLLLTAFLENNQKSKIARITVNSGDIFMQDKTNEFTYNLQDYVVQGSNYIRITPNNEFMLNGLKVTLQ